MRIVIDMQGVQTESRYRGIGRYSMSFVQAIVRNCGGHEIILVLNGLFPETIEPIREKFDKFLSQENILIWYAPGPVRANESGNESRRAAAELIREAFLYNLKPDVIHITSFFEGYVDDAVISIGKFDRHTPVSVSMYDLIPLLNPLHYLDTNELYKNFYLNKIEEIKSANLLLTISKFSRDETLQYLSVNQSSVINISTAIDNTFRKITIKPQVVQNLYEKYGLNDAFFLYTGGADERKNLPRLIEAYAQLPERLKQKHQLLIAGKFPQDNILSLKLIAKGYGLTDNHLIFTGYISDEELINLYNLCVLFVFPSWHEGFGLPALEALACGAAVIGANTSSIPEVIGNTLALFDPFDTKAITQKIIEVIENENLRNSLIISGIKQAKIFSWDVTARNAIEAFENLDINHNYNFLDYKTILEKLIYSIASKLSSDVNDDVVLYISHAISFIPDITEKKNLFLDVSELIQRDAKTGVQRVTRSIMNVLLKINHEKYFVIPVYATQVSFGYRYAMDMVGSEIRKDDPISYQAGDIFLGLDLQHNIVEYQKNYLRAIRKDGVKVIFVVYDLLPILIPDVFPSHLSDVHHKWLITLSTFDGVICISESVANELNYWLFSQKLKNERSFKVQWFHLGADINNSVPTSGLTENAEFILRKISQEITFLMVGTLEPRKGHEQVLDAFEILWQQGEKINLVIVGKQGWMIEQLIQRLKNHREFDKQLLWLSNVSDEFLEKIYYSSDCLIVASKGEGFGLPLIEAAQYKLPIIARDIPVFKEVAGNHAYYFVGDKSTDLSVAIISWLSLYEKNSHPKSDEMPWLTWEESAQQLLNAVLEIENNIEETKTKTKAEFH